MAFDTYELSREDSTPVELYTFVTPLITYRLTTYHKNISFGGNTFVATTGSRSNIAIVDLHDDSFDATVELPASHALVQYYANGIAPREVSCMIQRYQPSSGIALQIWAGYVTALSFKGRMGSFRIPSGTADALTLDVPSVVAQRLCNHILFDGRCQKLRTDFDFATTVAAISSDGRTITTAGNVPVDVDGGGTAGIVPWALHGELMHDASTERRTITQQIARNQFVLQCEFGGGGLGIGIGNPVTIYAGCNHTRPQCKAKYSNVINFGGHPDLPRSNIFYVGLTAAKFGS